MTDFELVTLYTEQTSLFINVITLLTTILFSYLVGMYFVSKRLSLVLFWILNFLFAFGMFAQLGAVFASGNRAVSIGQELTRRVESGQSQVDWIALNTMPPNIPRVMYYFFILASVLAVLFAVIKRHQSNKPSIKSK